MAVIQGHKGSVRDSAGALVGELTSFTLTLGRANEQHSPFGSEWVQTTATVRNWSLEASGMHDPNDAKQTAIITDIVSGDSVYSVECRTEGDTTGDTKYSGSMILENVSIEASGEGLMGFSFSGTGNDACTIGTVT